MRLCVYVAEGIESRTPDRRDRVPNALSADRWLGIDTATVYDMGQIVCACLDMFLLV